MDTDTIIEQFLKDNNLEIMHLELFLDSRGIVCIPQESYNNDDY